MRYYANSLQRILFATGQRKVLLSKNVLTTGRFQSLLETFPEARIVYITRTPLEAIPSFISMFSKPWQFHSPDITDNTTQYKALGRIIIDFYRYFVRMKSEVPSDHFVWIQYTDLKSKPAETVLHIYDELGLEPSDRFLERLAAVTRESRKYRSSHTYSLEAFGFTAREIHEAMPEVFEALGFEVPLEAP
jgi:hypothetical protein